MKTIDFYIIKKFLGTFFYAISLLIIIVVIFDFSEKIDDFIKASTSLSEIVFNYYLPFIPYFVNLFAYLFTFIAVIFFTSKMASNTEIIAILSSGISYRRLMRPYLLSAIFLAVFSYVLTNFVIPKTNTILNQFESKYLLGPRTTSDNNIHMRLDEDTYIYVESFNAITNIGHKFSIEKIHDGKMIYKLTSDRVIWDSVSNTWEAENYYSRYLEGEDEKVEKGKNLLVDINIKPEEFTIKVEDMKTMNLFALNKFIRNEKKKGTSNIIKYLVEKHKRLANPFATIILTIIGVSISSRKIRGGIGMHLGIGIAITFSYILFMQVSTVFATYGDLSPFLAAWIPNFIFGIVALGMLRYSPK